MVRVVIVDDDKLARKGLLTMLPWDRYDMVVVGEAANGAKALELLEDIQADLLFVDLTMPVMSGLDFIKAARVRYPDLQFVVLTFHEDFSFVQAALRLGVLDYISKLELENADYDAICMRLSQKFFEHERSTKCMFMSDAVEDPQPSWRKDLYALYWLYDHVALEELIRCIFKEPASPFALERMIVRAALMVETQTALDGLVVPPLRNGSTAADFLMAFRTDIFEKASKSVDLHRLSICLIKTILHVHTHLHGDLRTESVASRVALSRPYFSSSFSRVVGLPFHSYIRRERVQAAKALLLVDGLSIDEAAARVGYEDARSFIKMFLEQTGQTPAAFLRAHRSSNARLVR